MKRLVLLILMVAVILLVACNPEQDKSVVNEDRVYVAYDAVGKPSGTLKITLPSSQTRSIEKPMTNLTASSIVDTYAVFVWSENGALFNVDSGDYDGELPLIQLSVGNYKVLVVAGVGHNAIGFGYAENVAIVQDEVTNQLIKLSTLSYSISISDGPYYVSKAISLKYEMDLSNPYLGFSMGEYQVRGSDYNYWESNGRWATGKYEYVTNVALPLTAGTYELDSRGFVLSIIDSSSNLDELMSSGKSGRSWCVYTLDIDDNLEVDKYNAMFKYTLNVEELPTGANLTLEWEEDTVSTTGE